MRRKSALPIEQVDKLVTEIEDRFGYKICGYPSAVDVEPFVDICENKAGKGTTHVGTGNCMYHGGKGAPMTTGGLYSKYLQKAPDVLERYQEFLSDDDIKKIDNEIILIKTLLSKRIDTEKGWENTDGEKVDLGIIRLVDTISRLVEKKHRMENGEKYTISVDGLQNFLLQIINIIKIEVTDPVLQDRLLKRMQEEIKV